MDLKDLTPAEQRVWKAFPQGDEVNFQQADEDPSHGDLWGPERTVRAKVLRTLLLRSVTEGSEVPALRIVGARISGLLNLQYAIVARPVRLMGCYFEQTPNLYGARARQLNLSASFLPGLTAATIRVEGVLRLTDCRIPGEIRLGGAKISGAVFLDRAHLGSGQGHVLQLNQASIGDDLWGPGLTCDGQLRLIGAEIKGALGLEGARLSYPGETALQAGRLALGADFSGEGLRAEGRLDLRGAKIAGNVMLMKSRLSHPVGGALRASRCTAGELWLDEAVIEGAVYLRAAKFETIHATPDVWPTQVRLDGLTYETLAPRLPPEERLALLERDQDGYVPFAYEQLANAYRRIGDDSSARTVQLAKQRRHRRSLPWYAKVWGYAQDATVGYGYRPIRAASWLVILLAVGTVAFGLHHPPPMEHGKGPHFNALIYTLNLLLPIVDFGQAKAFNPQGPYQWLSYLLIAAGWILATTIVAGVTRAVSRQ